MIMYKISSGKYDELCELLGDKAGEQALPILDILFGEGKWSIECECDWNGDSD